MFCLIFLFQKKGIEVGHHPNLGYVMTEVFQEAIHVHGKVFFHKISH